MKYLNNKQLKETNTENLLEYKEYLLKNKKVNATKAWKKYYTNLERTLAIRTDVPKQTVKDYIVKYLIDNSYILKRDDTGELDFVGSFYGGLPSHIVSSLTEEFVEVIQKNLHFLPEKESRFRSAIDSQCKKRNIAEALKPVHRPKIMRKTGRPRSADRISKVG